VTVWKLFSDYIATWGERSVAELKLETVTYFQHPLLFARLLQSYLQSPVGRNSLDAAAPGVHRHQAETIVRERLKGKWLKRLLFRHVLRNARYFVTQRENLRYYRTRGFGMVRRMMLAIGEELAATNVITTARDVFWLELAEVEMLTSAPVPMHATIAQRKNVYEAYAGNALPERLTSYGPPKGLITRQPFVANRGVEGNEMRGIACSAGVVRSRVRLVTYSDDLKSLNGDILVTYATDPGFVVLFASASGILTERGSLLSHAAIVSREMGIPCIVGIDGLMSRLKDGDLIEMDGSTGKVTIIQS
jgi:pyruvate,water dikinase